MKPIISKNFEQDHSDRTDLIKDRIIPNIKSTMDSQVGALGGAVLGAGLGLANKRIAGKAVKKALNSQTGKKIVQSATQELIKNPDLYLKAKKIQKPLNAFMAPELYKAREVAAATAGALAMAQKGKEIGRISSNISSLKKQYMAQFGTEPSEAELMEAAQLNPKNRTHRAVSRLFYTPNAMTKSNFREMRQMYNAPNSLGKSPKELGGMVMPSRAVYPHVSNFNYYSEGSSGSVSGKFNKFSSENFHDIEKIAVDKKSIEQVNKAIRKAAPIVGIGIGAGIGTPAATMFSNHLVADDDKHKKVKRAIGSGLGIGTSAAIGGLVADDIGKIITGASDKILVHPKETFVNGLKNYTKLFKHSSYDYSDAIEKVALDTRKAREMVKSVGLAHKGNWKWALR